MEVRLQIEPSPWIVPCGSRFFSWSASRRKPALPQALVGSGRGALLSDALEGAADVYGLAPAPSSAPDELQRELVLVSGDHFVRRAPPSPRCRTWCRRSTWHGAPRRACGRPPP